MEKVFSRVLIKDEDHHILVIQDRANNWNFPGGKQGLGEGTFRVCKMRNTRRNRSLYSSTYRGFPRRFLFRTY